MSFSIGPLSTARAWRTAAQAVWLLLSIAVTAPAQTPAPAAPAQTPTPSAPAQTPAPAAPAQTPAPQATAQTPAPDAHFGFRMGADRQLVDADAVERYFELVASTSNRVRLVDTGPSTEGHRTIAAIVTAPANLARLADIQAANQRLADPRTLTAEEAAELARTHKAVLAIGCSIHASEVGATQMANELLHRLATATDADTQTVLDNVVLILIPMLNPDGYRQVADWYNKQKGTEFEGSALPWLYHKYVGHDINRDAFMMNLAESRNLARFFYDEWHPQVFLTMHQMGMSGPRFFVPPNNDPIDPNYDPLIWRTAGLLGGAMSFELQRQGRRGVLSSGIYDYFWPGYEDSAPLGHNTVCLLTEAASARLASPVTVPAADLRGALGRSEYRPHINFPDPWPGGEWTLRDIVDYDLAAASALLRAVAYYREPIVRGFYEMGRRAIDAGRTGGPYAFIIPAEQRDRVAAARLRELLLQGRVEIQRALEPFRADDQPYPAGTDIIFMAQPFRAYVKTLFERQNYPSRRDGPDANRPYDVAGWTLPVQMGVAFKTVEKPFEVSAMSRVTSATVEPAPVWGERRPGHYLIDARGVGGAAAAARLMKAGVEMSWLTTRREVEGFAFEPGSLVVPHSDKSAGVVAGIAKELGLRVSGVRGRAPGDAPEIGRARVAIYRSWTDNNDEGWTRLVFDRFGYPYTTIRDADLQAGELTTRFDTIILPSASRERLASGNAPGSAPPEYVGGIGDNGMVALMAFIDRGGTIVCLDQASEFGIWLFNLPMREVARSAGERFSARGSILRIDLDVSKPLTFGMEAQTAAFFTSSSAFDLSGAASNAPQASSGPNAAASGRPAPVLEAIARYGAKDILLSGYLEGEDVIASQAAVVEARIGRGRVLLFGFPPQHRGQSYATFRLLFNAVLTSSGADQFDRR
jgi:Zinc carboxypeptidase